MYFVTEYIDAKTIRPNLFGTCEMLFSKFVLFVCHDSDSENYNQYKVSIYLHASSLELLVIPNKPTEK